MTGREIQDLTEGPTPEGFRGRNKIVVQLWYLVQATLFRLSPHFMTGWRRFLVRLFGGKVGARVNFRPSATITYPWNLSVGDHSYIGDEVILYSLDQITIGSHVSISYRAFLCTGTHDPRDRRFPLVIKPIHIDDEVWLAADSFVAPGVHIGAGAVLAARSTALNDIPPRDMQVGTPARSIGQRTSGGEG
jgi:putative colanic acid biosynthesis acetyltransferase WcaF